MTEPTLSRDATLFYLRAVMARSELSDYDLALHILQEAEAEGRDLMTHFQSHAAAAWRIMAAVAAARRAKANRSYTHEA